MRIHRRASIVVFGIAINLWAIASATGAFAATSIDQIDLCAGETGVEFDVVVTNTVGERVIFRIGADNLPFSNPNERFAVNYSALDGSILDQAPEVQTFGVPPFDRWQDGPVSDFSATNEGPGRWRLEGTLANGVSPFLSGDLVWGIAIRADNDLFEQDIELSSCTSEPIEVSVPEVSSSEVPVLDGELSLGEWGDANRLAIDNGFMAFAHDSDRLYVLIDVLADDGDDPFAASGGDQFWLYFDVNRDGAITPDLDLRYRLESVTGNLRYQTFCDDCLFGFNPLAPQTFSARAEGFGCYFEDGSLNLDLTPDGLELNCSNHRVWELAIDLKEIGIDPTTAIARLGYLVGSGAPLLSENFPGDLNDMSEYIAVHLEGTPRTSTRAPGNFDNFLFEVTQAIQTTDNALTLVEGKPTAIRIWDPDVNETPIRGFVFADRNGIDLPGSPMLEVGSLAYDLRDDQRDTIVFNITEELQADWARGSVDFGITIQGLDGTIAAQRSATIDFVPTREPLFWTVPVRLNNTNSNTFVDVNEPSITASEQALLRVAPLAGADVVRRPRLDLDDISTSGGLKEELRTYDQQVALAWTIGLLLTGESPFDLPEQITGFTGRGLGTAGGSSDPAWWNSGAARITWISPDTNGGGFYGYAHELNHNLDTDPTGTWGRHAPGCGATGTDGSWPYGTSSTIQQVGIIRNMNQFNSVDPTTPDYMTYCSVGTNPTVWTSPYRWSAWLDLFRTDGSGAASFRSMNTFTTAGANDSASIETFSFAAAVPEPSFYVGGRVYPDGSAEIRRVLRQPGLPTSGADGGSYRLQVLDCSSRVLSGVSLELGFVDPEGVVDDFASFTALLPASPEACSIDLLKDGATIASRPISANPPQVELLVPNGGELWDGIHTVSWQAHDPDGDALQFTLLYSPDAGSTWLPVDTDLTGSEYALNTDALPGSEAAVLRVLASDGGNTASDDSDSPFSIAEKPVSLSIVQPVDQSIVAANVPIVLRGVSRDAIGNAGDGSDLVWFVDGQPAGTGAMVRVRLTEGGHLIELRSTAEGAAQSSVSVQVTAFTAEAVSDPADVAEASVDIASASATADAGLYTCAIDVRSGAEGLAFGSRFECLIDFDDLEPELETGCDADGNSVLDGSYQLGENGACPVSDMSVNYRHMRRAGECTGGPDVICVLEEFSADGASDDSCDGSVGGQPAELCRVSVSVPLEVVASERDAHCDAGSGDCFGGADPVSGTYGAHTYFRAQLRRHSDRVPDTDDGALPNSSDEVVLIQLTK